jgi:DNA polymerase II
MCFFIIIIRTIAPGTIKIIGNPVKHQKGKVVTKKIWYKGPMSGQNVYILSESSFVNHGKTEIRLFCTGGNGPATLIFTDIKPVFFIDRERQIPAHLFSIRKPVELKSFTGSDIDALYFETNYSQKSSSDFLKADGGRVYESDVRIEDRFLMERFVNRSLEFTFSPESKRGENVFVNPHISPSEFNPDLTSLSLDIETGQRGELYSIGLHYLGNREESRRVLIVSSEAVTPGEMDDFELVPLPDERSLLILFSKMLKELDPDLIIGWNVIGFDLRFLENKYREHGLVPALGRSDRPVRIVEKRSGYLSAELDGRIVLDGPQGLRSAFYKFEDFRLETVAQELLGRGKDISGEKDKVEEIERRFREDKAALARYNLEDCILVSEIFKKTGIVEQFLTRSLLTGLRLDKVSMSVAAFDFFYLPRLHRSGYVAPDVADIEPQGGAPGGYVFTSKPDMYTDVLIFDFRSLYPSIIRTFKIDPYSYLSSEVDPISTPSGYNFSATRHILPDFISVLLERRALAKKSKDTHLSQAVKILMNSYYGVMGTPGCRFYNPILPAAITETGQWVLKETASFLRGRGHTVLYGDTDSVFIQINPDSGLSPAEAGETLTEHINEHFKSLFEKEYHVESFLELEFEKHYEKFLLPPVRGNTGGALKRYAGKIAGSGELEITGLEFVRSDWTPLAKIFQYELFRRLFAAEDIFSFILETVQKLKDGELDEQLVYSRRLRRPAGEYEKNTPPHVKAALLLDPGGKKKIRSVKYVITRRGPIPLELPHDDIDYSHYTEKQIKPLANGVLFLYDRTFDEIIGGRQLELFS